MFCHMEYSGKKDRRRKDQCVYLPESGRNGRDLYLDFKRTDHMDVRTWHGAYPWRTGVV